MDKHTEGPWETEIAQSDGYVVSFIGSRTIAKVYGRNASARNANVRLIAAAPELLDALRDLVDAVAEEHDDDISRTCAVFEPQQCTLCMARAAIAKAEGNVNA